MSILWIWPACQQIGWEGCSHGLNFSAFVLRIEEFTTYTRNTVILGVLASHWELLPSDNEKGLCLSLPPSWPAMRTCPHEEWHYLPLVPCPTLLFPICCEVCAHYHCSCLLGQQPGGTVENPNSPFGTWEPHTSFFWWFLFCFVLFKWYEDNTSSAGPREEWHQTLPLQANAHCFPSLQQGQSFSRLQLGGHGRYD